MSSLSSQLNNSLLLKKLSPEKLKHPLDTINMLLEMDILDQKPSFPKMFVMSDASAFAESVIGTLVGLNLPCNIGVPIVLNFTTHSVCSLKIWLQCSCEELSCEKEVCEAVLASEIEAMVKTIPEDKRSYMDVNVCINHKLLISDLTIILLPGIHTQPDKDKQKKEIELLDGYIKRHERYAECFYLNIVSYLTKFQSCLSRTILEQHYRCYNTISIFPKLYFTCEYLVERLSYQKAPFGYFFIDDAIEDGHKTERSVLLSEYYKDYIGYGAISKNVVIAMLSFVFTSPFDLLSSIESDLQKSMVSIEQCKKMFNSASDAIPDIFSIAMSVGRRLNDLFIRGDYTDYKKEKFMHAAFNIQRKLKRLKTDLQDLNLDNERPFLMYEIELLNIPGQILPSPCIFGQVLGRQFSYASSIVYSFVSSIMDYIERVVVKVILNCAENNIQFHHSLKEICKVLVEGVRKRYDKKVEELLDMEKEFQYTCKDDYARKCNEMNSVKLELDFQKEFTSIDGIGNRIRVDHLKNYSAGQLERAFELKRYVVVYWEFVVSRFVDYCALNLQSLIKTMISREIVKFIAEDLMKCAKDGRTLPNVESKVAIRKKNLERRIEFLNKAKEDIKKWQVI